MNAREITAALKGRWNGRNGSVCCPAHDDREPSLLVSDGDAGVRVHCLAGCPWQAVKAELARLGLIPNHSDMSEYTPTTTGAERRAERERMEAEAAAERQRRTEAARAIWNATQDATDSPVSAYLASRGITSVPMTIRHHAALKHAPTGQLFTAMVACVTKWPTREIVGVHRTFLMPGGRGKAQVSSAKMSLGALSGGAVRLAPVKDSLALAEGIETALSVQQATGTPTWACLSTSGLKRVVIPDDVTSIQIFADGDEPGEKAACAAAQRFMAAGKAVKVIRPEAGADFNDLLQMGETHV